MTHDFTSDHLRFHDIGIHDRELEWGCPACEVDAQEMGVTIPWPTCPVYDFPGGVARGWGTRPTELCGKPATKVCERDGQPIYRCDKHAVGIQATYYDLPAA